MRENPKPFEVYRHFKGNMYQILTLAADSEDDSMCVVYQAMYGEYKVYVRKLEMFMSETDHEKYPDCTQKYRFEKISAKQEDSKQPDIATQEDVKRPEIPAQEDVKRPEIPAQESQSEIDAGVLEYIEAETVESRLNILASLHHRITDEMINTMAVVIDVEINEGNVEQRYQELKNCLLMKQKFEKQRY